MAELVGGLHWASVSFLDNGVFPVHTADVSVDLLCGPQGWPLLCGSTYVNCLHQPPAVVPTVVSEMEADRTGTSASSSEAHPGEISPGSPLSH